MAVTAAETQAPQQATVLFDHLVGDGEHTRRNFEAEPLGCLEIDDQLELRGAVDRELARLGAPADTASLDTCA